MDDRTTLLTELDQTLAAPTPPPAEQEAALGKAVKQWLQEARAFEASAVNAFIRAEHAYTRRAELMPAAQFTAADDRQYQRVGREWEEAGKALDVARTDLAAALEARGRLWRAQRRWRQAEAAAGIRAHAEAKAARQAQLARTAAERYVAGAHRQNVLTRAAQAIKAASTWGA
jgi:hypothetical protein